MNTSKSEISLGGYRALAMSDEERAAILADIILEVINSEKTQGTEAEG